MKAFMDQDFLLSTPTARTLFNDYAKDMPIVDYHCHVSPREIAEDRRFDNITQAWLGGDHYKWRLMRAQGIEESLITGDAPDREKFQAFAEALPRAIGNAVHHGAHLELRFYFGCDLVLGPDTAEEIWNICNEKLRGGLTVREMIRRAGVTTVCTTDDPIDSLEWHAKMEKDETLTVKVLPAFRPDKAVNAEKPGFADYIAELGKAAGMTIATLADLEKALSARLDHFGAHGCRASDHGLDYVMFSPDHGELAPAVFQKALAGKTLTTAECEAYKTALLLFFGREYARRGWVMQLHYGAQRNVNPQMFRLLGPDTGFDCIDTRDCAAGITGLLGALAGEEMLPKPLLYSLNPGDNAMLDSVIGCYSAPGTPGKVQHGSAWWFNDTLKGMEEQMASLASIGMLGCFVGMLTDSRSFLSYTRHEYFRRILCGMLGRWVENGEYPADMETLDGIVRDISYNNAMGYFGF